MSPEQLRRKGGRRTLRHLLARSHALRVRDRQTRVRTRNAARSLAARRDRDSAGAFRTQPGGSAWSRPRSLRGRWPKIRRRGIESARLLQSDLLELKQRLDTAGGGLAPGLDGFVNARSRRRRSVPIQGADRRGARWPRCWRRGSRRRCFDAASTCRRPRPSSGTTAAPAPFAKARIFRRARLWSARSRSTTRSPWRALGRPRPTRRSSSPTEPGRNCCRPWRCSRIARRLSDAESMYLDAVAATLSRNFKTAIDKYSQIVDSVARRRKVCGICRSRPRLRERRESRRGHRIVREGDAAGSAVGRRIPPFRNSLWPSPGILEGERRILEGAGHLSGHVEPGRAGRGVLPAGIVAGQDQETARSQRAAGTIAGDVTKFVQRLPIDQDRTATQQRVLR